jgi:hypothetical protein
MKKLYMLICGVMFFLVTCHAQNRDSLSFQAGWGILNYAVPESPAFKILGVSPDNILKPTSTRDIAIAVGNYYSTNNASIPKNLSVDIAPSLFNPAVSLIEYQNFWTRLWYTSTFSVGTLANSNGSYAVSAGFKLKIIDEADLRTNTKLNDFMSRNGFYVQDAFLYAVNEEAKELAAKDTSKTKSDAKKVGDALFQVYSSIADTSTEMARQIYHEVIDVKKLEYGKNHHFNFNALSEFRDSLKETLWNALTWDVGIATLFASKDSLIKDISAPSKAGLWTALGLPLGISAQLLIGANALLLDDKDGFLNQWSGGLGARLYYGVNSIKGFAQAESDFQQSVLPLDKVGIGLETTFFDGIWFDVVLGVQKTGSQNATFTPSFNISYAPAEKSK